MQRRRTKPPKRLAMLRCAVALVLSKAIAGILHVKPFHHAVATNLCDDRGGRNRKRQRVTSDDGLSRTVKRWRLVAIDQHQARRAAEFGNSALHRPQRCRQNVIAIDSFSIGKCDTHLRHCKDLVEERLALGFLEFLGVGDTAWHIVRIQHNRRCNHRSRPRSAPSFINAGNNGMARRARTFFKLQRGAFWFARLQSALAKLWLVRARGDITRVANEMPPCSRCSRFACIPGYCPSLLGFTANSSHASNDICVATTATTARRPALAVETGQLACANAVRSGQAS